MLPDAVLPSAYQAIIINGLSAEISPDDTDDEFTRTCYLVEDDVLEDGTIVTHCSDRQPRSGYTLEMIMNVSRVSSGIYSVSVEAYTGAALILIKSFTAVLNYGNGGSVQGLGVNQSPTLNGCSTRSIITFPNRVYSSGTYTLGITSYRLVICEYINTNNTEEADLFLTSETIVVS